MFVILMFGALLFAPSPSVRVCMRLYNWSTGGCSQLRKRIRGRACKLRDSVENDGFVPSYGN